MIPGKFVTLSVITCLMTTYISAKEKGEMECPNILFILSDDHTSQSWGIYGGVLSKYAKNDNIKRLAAEGCVLDNCFCTNSISVPSRASILTGAYSHRNGVYSLADMLAPGTDNIAKRLQSGGYQTSLFGKWHLKSKPEGFDDFAVFHEQGVYFNPIFKTKENWVDRKNVGDRVEGFSTDIVTDKTIAWIRNRNKTKPFMTCCHFKATHEPCFFPERMKHLYDGVEFPMPENLMDFDGSASGRTFPGQRLEILGERWEQAGEDSTKYPELPFKVSQLGKEQARKAIYQKFIRNYLRCGATIDENIGRLLQALEAEGLLDNTIVVYVSDQGYFLGEHGFFDKRMMYEESLRMPFVIRYPKEIPAGTRNEDIILNIDFASLFADYANTDVPDLSQGKSFRENLKGNTSANWRQSMYYRYWTQHTVRPAHMGVRTDRYKLMFLYGDRLNTTDSEEATHTPTWEFYDLRLDPGENKNEYHNPQYVNVIKEMKAEMLRLRKEIDDQDEATPRMREIMETYW